MSFQISLQSKHDVAVALLDLIRPLKSFYSEGKALLAVGSTGVHYGEKIARMEGFARVVWGLGPLFSSMDTLAPQVKAEAEEWRQLCLTGIINGTDPTHPEYWGTVADYDQRLVEMAPLMTAVSLAPEKLWEPLTDAQKHNLYQYMDQANHVAFHSNNWRYFRILVNMTFRLLGLPWAEDLDKSDRQVIEDCYLDDGWYFDGNPGQVDYYVAFAIHFYGLIYAKKMEHIEPEYCAILKERSAKFSHDYIYWFANNGEELPFGRSLTYRFAHSSYFGAMAFADVDGVGYGVMKNLLFSNLEHWFARPIFDNAGVLTIGYGYPNMFMSEPYNGAGSPYWALKGFFVLAVPDDHPFWKAERETFTYAPQKHLKHPHMLITHDENNHVLSYVTGQWCRNQQCHCPEKYAKFVYSNQFGFSVLRETELPGGAFDNTFVASYAGENDYKTHYHVDAFDTSDQSVRMNYKLLRGVSVKTILVPCGAWHVRAHLVTTAETIDVADGGFSIESEHCFHVVSGATTGCFTPDEITTTDNSVLADTPYGMSAVHSLTDGKGTLITCMPNTNLLYNATILPMACQTLPAGEHLLVSCVFGDRSATAHDKYASMPQVTIDGTTITVKDGERTITETFLA